MKIGNDFQPLTSIIRRARLASCAVVTILTIQASVLAAQGQDGQSGKIVAELSEISLDDLMPIRVITASRSEQILSRSTSVMSMITSGDIERRGFRTIYEVLATVPGFFASSQATWKLVGSRGF